MFASKVELKNVSLDPDPENWFMHNNIYLNLLLNLVSVKILIISTYIQKEDPNPVVILRTKEFYQNEFHPKNDSCSTICSNP
jgi:hypothetical protein